jgi:hypothetical protein
MTNAEIDHCKARIDAMLELLAAGWEPKHIALALGMAKSWAIAEQLMRSGKPER